MGNDKAIDLTEQMFLKVALQVRKSTYQEMSDAIFEHIKPLLTGLEIKVKQTTHTPTVTWGEIQLEGDVVVLIAEIIAQDKTAQTLILRMDSEILNIRDSKNLMSVLDELPMFNEAPVVKKVANLPVKYDPQFGQSTQLKQLIALMGFNPDTHLSVEQMKYVVFSNMMQTESKKLH